MKTLALVLVLVVLSSAPVWAAPARSWTDVVPATIQDRARMAQEIADDVHYDGKSNVFKTDAVELGAAAIEGNTALADWRSADRTKHGQVYFFYICDHWNVGKVSIGRPLTARELETNHYSAHAVDTTKLIAELKKLESHGIAYLNPPHFGATC